MTTKKNTSIITFKIKQFSTYTFIFNSIFKKVLFLESFPKQNQYQQRRESDAWFNISRIIYTFNNLCINENFNYVINKFICEKL